MSEDATVDFDPKNIIAVLLPDGKWHDVIDQSTRIRDARFEGETHNWRWDGATLFTVQHNGGEATIVCRSDAVQAIRLASQLDERRA